jgi:hypothetical protein
MTVPAGGGSETGTVIKTDRMGRMRFSRAQREKILGAFEASGMSAVGFAEHHGMTNQDDLRTLLPAAWKEQKGTEAPSDASRAAA